ncbi:hypothetical protein DOTSEDRAFT_22300 [Dothistroma septosporum NZE10]|uniref:Uncharacterized protein n=1 Tax=Dothistroma septosporum (strain NZE10 / CBS 128990) TaxID=675120 RepID=N1PTB5_DOTSN|nr:hypothetical protein DOTSEDRAFT_22300 [Dothistroma septosporum NZE10]
MPPWRLHPIADIATPKRDHYDGNSFVAPHFSYTPDLMPVDVVYEHYGSQAQAEKWKPIARDIGCHARTLYLTHGLQVCNMTKAGLYLAGSNEDMKDPDRDRMMVLVFELEVSDCHRWQDVDIAARALLKDLDMLCDAKLGICLRYYVRERRAAPNPRRAARSANPLQDNLPPSSPLYDPYGEDQPSIRRMPRVRLSPNDARPWSEFARSPIGSPAPRGGPAMQHMFPRYRADAERFRTDNDDFLAPPYSESNRAVVGEQPSGQEQEDTGQVRSAIERGRDSATLARRYSRLAQRIDREHEYIIEAQLNDYRLCTQYFHTTTPEWEDGDTVKDSDSDCGSDDDPDDELQFQSDAEGDDWRVQIRVLPRIDRGGLPAARNRAVQYLRQMTRSDHDKHFGGAGGDMVDILT